MSTLIQIRNVPEDVHRALKARAAKEGRTLSDLCLNELRNAARRPTLADVRDRLSRFPPLGHDVDAAALVRKDREGR